MDFLAVIHFIGNDGAVVHFAHQFHKGFGGQQSTAVTGGGFDGAFKRLHNAVFIGIDKVKNHALAAVGIFAAPGNAFALRLAFFIEISDVAGTDTHLHLAVLGGADQVDDHIFIFSHRNTVPAGILLHLENAVFAHFHVVQGNHITVFGYRAGDGGTAGGIRGQGGNLATAQVAPFPGYFLRIIQQLISIALIFHISDADHIAALDKLAVDERHAVHLHIAHFQVGIIPFRVKIRLIGIVIVDQYVLDLQILIVGVDNKIFVLLQFLVPFFIISAGFGAKGQGGGIIGGIENTQTVAFALLGVVHHLADVVVVMGRGRKAGAVGNHHAIAVLLTICNIAVAVRLEHIQTGIFQIVANIPGEGSPGIIGRDGLFRAGTAHVFPVFILVQGKFHAVQAFGSRYAHFQRIIHGMEIGAAGVGKDGIGIPIHIIHTGAGFRMGILLPFSGHRAVIERITKIVENAFRRQILDDHIPFRLCRAHGQ